MYIFLSNLFGLEFIVTQKNLNVQTIFGGNFFLKQAELEAIKTKLMVLRKKENDGMNYSFIS